MAEEGEKQTGPTILAIPDCLHCKIVILANLQRMIGEGPSADKDQDIIQDMLAAAAGFFVMNWVQNEQTVSDFKSLLNELLEQAQLEKESHTSIHH